MSQKKINHLLIVDDSVPNTILCKKLLENTCQINHIFTVYDGEQALDYVFKKENYDITNSYPDVVLLDINMPNMDGFEFLRVFQEHQEFLNFNPFIVMLTSSDWNADRLQADSNNLVQGFIEKPLNPEKVKALIQDYEAYIAVS